VLAALENVPLGVSITARRGDEAIRLYANRALAEMVGVPFDQFVLASPLAALAPEELERFRALVAAWQGTPQPGLLETRITGPDGRRVPVEIRSGGTKVGELPLTVNFVTDLGPRLAMEAAVRDSEARFRGLCEACPDAIMVMSGGRVVYANVAAARVLRFDAPEALLARPVDELVVAEELAFMRERIAAVSSGQRLTPFEYRARAGDGEVVRLEVSSIAIIYQGAPAVLGVARDITERKRLQAELLRADRMAAVGTLAAGVAHEVNNPLTYVLIHLRRLRGMLPEMIGSHRDRARVEQLLAEVEDGSERVARIVRDLLAFARPGGEEPLPVVVSDVWESVLHLAASSFEKRVRVVRRLGTLPAVVGDPARLAQVFLNLLLNAVQALAPIDPSLASIEIGGRIEGDVVVIDVDDNGNGIPERSRSQVFEPFYTTKPPGQGTGLGLAISRMIIEAYGGSIQAAESPSGGARLTLRLRVYAPGERQPATHLEER
jgi:two-component system, NtrC family, sensor kinase